MNFPQAVERLFSGSKIARNGWNGKGMYIGVQEPHVGGDMDKPYAYIVGTDGKGVPWIPSQSDLFADDWIEVTL